MRPHASKIVGQSHARVDDGSMLAKDELSVGKRRITICMAGGIIAVGRGPKGPSIEGPFCRTVYLCCTLEDRKMGNKREKKKENKEKERKNRKKNRKK